MAYDLSRIEKGQKVSPIDGSSRHSIRCDQTRRLNERVFIWLLARRLSVAGRGEQCIHPDVFCCLLRPDWGIGIEDFFLQLKGVYIFLVVTHLCCWPE